MCLFCLQRLKNWEARERKKTREYEKEREKEEERKAEEVSMTIISYLPNQYGLLLRLNNFTRNM